MTTPKLSRVSVGNDRGFTLVELLLVATILGALAGALAMSTSNQSGASLDLVSMQIEDSAKRTLTLARSNRSAYGLFFEVGTDRVAIADASGQLVIDPFTHGLAILDFEQPGQPGNINIVSADFGAAGTAFLVDPQGVPLAGGTVVLTRSGQTVTLTFDEATGTVSSS